MQSRQKQGPGVQRQELGRRWVCPASPQHNPQPSWPLAIAQAETEKLGMGGARLLVLE